MEQNIIDLRRFWRAVKKTKYVYAAMIVAFLSLAIWQVNRSMKKYPVIGEMLIGEESMTDGGAGALAAAKGAGGMSQMLKTFSIGGFGGAAVDNEVLVLCSHDVMLRTVKNLGLSRSYIGLDKDGKRHLLWRDTPVRVEAPEEYFDTLSVGYNIKVNMLPDGKVNLVATKGFFGRKIAEASNVELPTLFKTPCGSVQILKADNFLTSPCKEITVSVKSNSLAAIGLAGNMNIDVMTKLSDVIEVGIETANPEMGKAIVDGVMAEYNSKRLDRIHETAVNSIKYYDERISETLKQLEKAEQEVADYKRSTSMSAIDAEAKVLTQMSAEGKAQVIATQHTIDYYQTVLSALRGDLSTDALIPRVSTVGDTTIAAYNNLIMKRRNLRRSATDDNTALMLLNQEISSMASLIQTNAEQMISKAKSDLNMHIGLTGMAAGRMDKYPEMELDYTGLARNKEFQNALYLYLVQARENAVLKLYADTDLGYVFQPAYVDKAKLPIKSILIVIAAVIMAILVSTCVALIVKVRSQGVKQPMDLASIGLDKHTVNFNGEDSAARLRTMIMSDKNRKVIYAADFASKNGVLEGLPESFRKAGFNVSHLTADSNDMLLSPEFEIKLAESLKKSDYTFVTVPAPTKLFELENEIDHEESCLVAFVPDTMKRKEFKKMLSGQTVGKVFVAIVG